MSRKIKINGQLVDFETLVSRDNDYKNKIWRYRKDGEVEAVDSTSLTDDDIVFSGSKSNLRRLADIERNVSILSTKVLTTTNTNSYDSDDDNFGSIFDQDVRFKGEVRIDSTPTNTTDAVSKGYVDTAVSNVSVDLTGYATETFVNTAVSNLVDAAPTTLDTLNELAAALGDDPNFATTVTNSIGLKANSADLATVATSGAYSDLTGKPTIPADISDLTDTTNLLAHFSGNYNDLTNLPTLFDGQYSSLTGAPSIPTDISDLTDTTSLLGQGGSSVEYSTTAPSTPSTGDLWYDTSVAEMYIWSGSAWISTTAAVVVDLSTTSIDNFSDVDTTTSVPSNGDLLIWNATNSAWEPGAAPATYGDSDVGTYLSSNGYDTAANITAAIVDTAPTTLDTLNELAAALGDDPNFATTITAALGNKADISSVPTDIADLTDTTNLLTHFSGSYDDLTDVPFSIESGIPTIHYSEAQPIITQIGELWFDPSTSKWYRSIASPNTATVDNTQATVTNVSSITGGNTDILPAPGGTSITRLYNVNAATLVFNSPLWLTQFSGRSANPEIRIEYVIYEDGTRYDFPNSTHSYSGAAFNVQRITQVRIVGTYHGNNTPYNLTAAGAPSWEEIDSGGITLADITSADLDMGTNKILYSNVYDNLVDLPSASSYHGMFAHVHGTGKAYYAHAGSWVELANVSELPSLTGYATETFVNTAISNLVNGADAAFDTLKEIQDAMATDTELATAISNLVIPSALTDLGITDGTANQVLVTDGAGNFTFADAASGGGASIELSDTAPSSPSAGGLWFKTDTLKLYVYFSSNWVEVGGGVGGSGGGASVTVDTTAPGSPSEGDLWYNSNYGDLLIYLGNAWVLVGGSTGSTQTNWSSSTTNITMINSQKVLVDTTSSAVTLTLPASPTLGDEVRIIDAAGNAATNNITVARNGSNIMGLAEDFVININEAAFGLVYFNATRGWVLTEK